MKKKLVGSLGMLVIVIIAILVLEGFNWGFTQTDSLVKNNHLILFITRFAQFGLAAVGVVGIVGLWFNGLPEKMFNVLALGSISGFGLYQMETFGRLHGSRTISLSVAELFVVAVSLFMVWAVCSHKESCANQVNQSLESQTPQ